MTELQAGPELDALVAERVMGLQPGVDFGSWSEHYWKRLANGEIDDFGLESEHHNGPMCARCYYAYCEHCQDGPDQPCAVKPPRYSTEIQYAWRVIERIKEIGDHYCKWDMGQVPDGWSVVVGFKRKANGRMEHGYGHAAECPEAICRAALAAIGGGK